jgi:hypothetical protein
VTCSRQLPLPVRRRLPSLTHQDEPSFSRDQLADPEFAPDEYDRSLQRSYVPNTNAQEQAGVGSERDPRGDGRERIESDRG